MFIIVSNKPGVFHSRTGDGVRTVESWKYLFYGKERAVYTICEVVDPEARIDIIDATDENCVNSLHCKFFGSFDDIDAARAEVRTLTHFGDLDATIIRVD